jgi:hypothetical protein
MTGAMAEGDMSSRRITRTPQPSVDRVATDSTLAAGAQQRGQLGDAHDLLVCLDQDRFIQAVLAAEVVVDSGHVDAGTLADLFAGRVVVALLSKNLSRDIQGVGASGDAVLT